MVRGQDLHDALRESGLEDELIDAVAGRWRLPTHRAYATTWRRWRHFCVEHAVAWQCPTPSDAARFLLRLFREHACGASALRNACSALRALLRLVSANAGPTAADHELVASIVAMAARRRPSQIRDDVVETQMIRRRIIDHVRERMADNSRLREEDLRRKSIVLLRLVTVWRSSDVARAVVPPDQCSVRDGLSIRRRDPKTRNGLTTPTSAAALPRRHSAVCPVRALLAYVERTGGWDGRRALFVRRSGTRAPLSAQAISKDAAKLMQSAGVDMTVARAHDVRATAFSAAANRAVPIEVVLRQGDIRHEPTGRRHYWRGDSGVNFSRVVLVPEDGQADDSDASDADEGDRGGARPRGGGARARALSEEEQDAVGSSDDDWDGSGW